MITIIKIKADVNHRGLIVDKYHLELIRRENRDFVFILNQDF